MLIFSDYAGTVVFEAARFVPETHDGSRGRPCMTVAEAIDELHELRRAENAELAADEEALRRSLSLRND